ncbi:MAG TPA: hypothetical protein VNI83_02165 [Vicinamibacterales bacterium]|nr:hypothetical protein [Vicinamibacterales bacterium]
MPLGGLIPYDLNDQSVKLAQEFLGHGNADGPPAIRTKPLPTPVMPGADQANGLPLYRTQPIESKPIQTRPFMPPGLTNENMAAFGRTPAGRAIIDSIMQRINPQASQPAVRAWRRRRAPR